MLSPPDHIMDHTYMLEIKTGCVRKLSCVQTLLQPPQQSRRAQLYTIKLHRMHTLSLTNMAVSQRYTLSLTNMAVSQTQAMSFITRERERERERERDHEVFLQLVCKLWCLFFSGWYELSWAACWRKTGLV